MGIRKFESGPGIDAFGHPGDRNDRSKVKPRVTKTPEPQDTNPERRVGEGDEGPTAEEIALHQDEKRRPERLADPDKGQNLDEQA